MKTMKKVLAFMLALAMVVTAVPVTNAEAATGLPKSRSYYAGKTYTLKLTTPSSWKSVSTKWSATNNNTKAVAISDKKTKSVTVKALKKGKAVVTAKVTYKKGGVKTTKTYKCNVRVKAPTITASPKQVELKVGETQQIAVKYVPASAVVSYKTSNADVATVTKDGLIKAVSGKDGGECVVTAVLRCGKKVKESPVKVVVTATAQEDGLHATVTNEMDKVNYPGVVTAAAGANVSVYYGDNGAGMNNEYVRISYRNTSDYAKTDANGFAYFTIPNVGVEETKFTVTADGNPELKDEGTIIFATVKSSSNVYVVNGKGKAHNGKVDDEDYVGLGFKGIVPSENDANGVSGTGITTTSGTYSSLKNDGVKYVLRRQFVDSQQVSLKDDTNHKVGFVGGLPVITLPVSGATVAPTESFTQEVNLDSKEYHTYEYNNVQWIEVEKDPEELVYATLNFTDLKLSQYTHMKITAYNGKESYNNPIAPATYVYGPTDQKSFGYQIPLGTDITNHVWVKVELRSEGQVDTGKNAGYKISNITGIIRQATGAATRDEYLKGAQITWEKATPVMSVERELTEATYKDKLVLAADVKVFKGETDPATKKEIARSTYKVPVYPYTGNAVITTYDKNGAVIAYFACPTVNAWYYCDSVLCANASHYNAAGQRIAGGVWHKDPEAIIDVNEATALGIKNYNVLTDRAYTYRISAEEATKSVGTVSQNGSLVTVNSEEAGVTTLVGTITGVATEAINEKVYTSVQWCPVPNTINDNSGAIALTGQMVAVKAQLFDKNGNAVAKANEPITFSYNDNGTPTVIGNAGFLNPAKIDGDPTKAVAGAASATVQAVSVQKSTDSLGQATLMLCASEVAALVGINATTTSRYNVAISVNGNNVEKLDLYWMNAVTKFVDKTKNPAEYVACDVAGICKPNVGEAWEYAFTTTAVRNDYVGLGGNAAGLADDQKLPQVGIWSNYVVQRVENAKIGLEHLSWTKGKVTTDTGVNGMAIATSTEAGKTQIKATVDGTPVTGEVVTFVIRNAENKDWSEKKVENLGAGFSNVNSATIDVDWQNFGSTGNFITVNGAKASKDRNFTVKFKVTDSYGNIDKDSVVKITSSLSGGIASITSAGQVRPATAVNYAKANPNDGIIEITLKNTYQTLGGGTPNKAGLRELVSCEVNGVLQTIQIIWVTANTPVLVESGLVNNYDANANYSSYADEKKIVLTFANADANNGSAGYAAVNIDGSTVKKEMFSVYRNSVAGNTSPSTGTYGAEAIDISTVAVSGNTITLTFRTPYTDNLMRTFKVDIATGIKSTENEPLANGSYYIHYTK